jgi:hypothetical protein
MVAKALPSRELVLQLLTYDADSGVFVWRPRTRWMFPNLRSSAVWNAQNAGKSAGWVNTPGYLVIAIDRAAYLAHRLAWLMHHGEPVPDCIDHIDGDPLNNRIGNLRAALQRQNIANAKLRNDNTTGAKGVHRQRGGRFFARVTVGGVLHHLGTFDTVEEAAEARRDGAARLHGKFARHE